MTILFLVLALIIVFVVANKINNRGIISVNAQEAQELVKDPAVAILDVRTTQEFEQGHIQGAKLMPVAQINNRINELASLKDRKILIYCHSGNRSRAASRILIKNGFKNVMHFQGGITAWIDAGLAINK